MSSLEWSLWCLLLMEGAEWILKFIELYFLLRFSQMLQNNRIWSETPKTLHVQTWTSYLCLRKLLSGWVGRPSWAAFHFLNVKLKAESHKQPLTESSCSKAFTSLSLPAKASQGRKQICWYPWVSRLIAVIECKGFIAKYLKKILIYVILSKYFWVCNGKK